MPRRHTPAFTILELLVVVSVIAILMSLLLPAAGRARDSALINVSRSNLRQLGVAHKTYAADWAGRHVTYTRDSLGRYGGDVREYNAAIYGDVTSLPGGEPTGFEFHPPIVAGRGYNQFGEYVTWAYWSTGANRVMFQPLNFPGPPHANAVADGWGWFRFGIMATAFNSYVNQRAQDPIFYAPKDRHVYDRVQQCFEVAGEFVAVPRSCNPSWASYCMSPAALFDPQVFADNGHGEFWTAPWTMPSGYRVPGFDRAKYPTLKTHMLEHHWLQNAKMPCNQSFFGCEPFFFNHSLASMPVTLFYDGSVRLTSVTEAMSADRRQRRQTGHGLWSRDTPFGGDGYFIADSFDFAETSYHTLTIDGIRGRDVIGAE